MPRTHSLIDCSQRERLNGVTRTADITVQHFRNKCFVVVVYGKNNGEKPRNFLVKRVSALSMFIATAYDIRRFSAISETKT